MAKLIRLFLIWGNKREAAEQNSSLADEAPVVAVISEVFRTPNPGHGFQMSFHFHESPLHSRVTPRKQDKETEERKLTSRESWKQKLLAWRVRSLQSRAGHASTSLLLCYWYAGSAPCLAPAPRDSGRRERVWGLLKFTMTSIWFRQAESSSLCRNILTGTGR